MVHASREESEEYSSNDEKVQPAQRSVRAACEASGLRGAINNPFLLTLVSAYLPRPLLTGGSLLPALDPNFSMGHF